MARPASACSGPMRKGADRLQLPNAVGRLVGKRNELPNDQTFPGDRPKRADWTSWLRNAQILRVEVATLTTTIPREGSPRGHMVASAEFSHQAPARYAKTGRELAGLASNVSSVGYLPHWNRLRLHTKEGDPPGVADVWRPQTAPRRSRLVPIPRPLAAALSLCLGRPFAAALLLLVFHVVASQALSWHP